MTPSISARHGLPSLALALLCCSCSSFAQQNLPTIPVAASPVILDAVTDGQTGKASFAYQGKEIPPVIHASPGQTIQVDYRNHLTSHSGEQCTHGSCSDMTNLHFHGLHVSPQAPQDDVLTMMAMPGESLHYRVEIPGDQPPGLYWYHTHPHGESYRQLLDGMSGAIIIDGMERYVPEVRSLRERLLILRDTELEQDAPSLAEAKRVELPATGCSRGGEAPERIFTVNGVIRPSIDIAPGERQFWRIVNASPDLYADLAIDASTMKVIARDGMPLAYHDPSRPFEMLEHILVPPAGRVEAIITGPPAGTHASLRTRCVDTGPDGDPNPAMVLADLNTAAAPHRIPASSTAKLPPALHKRIAAPLLAHLKSTEPAYIVRFTEDKHGFYINGKAFEPSDAPMLTVNIGDYQHWRVINETGELHPFHIHQVHFLPYATNAVAAENPDWLDTVNVPVGGTVDMVMDFTDPIIRGMSVFHCHLIQHEDKGMMAKILFQ